MQTFTAVFVPLSILLERGRIGGTCAAFQTSGTHAQAQATLEKKGNDWLAYYPLCIVSTSNVSGGFEGGPGKAKFFFSAFGLLTILFAMSVPIIWARFLTGVTWEA